MDARFLCRTFSLKRITLIWNDHSIHTFFFNIHFSGNCFSTLCSLLFMLITVSKAACSSHIIHLFIFLAASSPISRISLNFQSKRLTIHNSIRMTTSNGDIYKLRGQIFWYFCPPLPSSWTRSLNKSCVTKLWFG